MHIQQDVPLAPLTTFHIGGTADFFVTVTSVPEVHEAVTYAEEHKLPITILAGGSNVLVSDNGVRGLVIKIDISGISIEEETDTAVIVVAGAGEVFDALVTCAVIEGWWGLENLSAIPGSVGATPIQNVGAYGVEIEDVIKWVEVFDTKELKVKKLLPEECGFRYRTSVFKEDEGKRYVVTRVAYRLSKEPKPQLSYRDLTEWFKDHSGEIRLEKIRAAVMHIRSRKFPDWHTLGTAGSFFKNPILSKEEFDALQEKYPAIPSFSMGEGSTKVPLGWILDKVLNLRGVRSNSVGTYEGQALVFVNYGNAKAADVEAFANKIAKQVLETTGITLEREVTNV